MVSRITNIQYVRSKKMEDQEQNQQPKKAITKQKEIEVLINVETFCSIMKYSTMIVARLKSYIRRQQIEDEQPLSSWKEIYNKCMNVQ
jgi:hypothetical protein